MLLFIYIRDLVVDEGGLHRGACYFWHSRMSSK